jgi:4-carboxymuconolactone decarboxylase
VVNATRALIVVSAELALGDAARIRHALHAAAAAADPAAVEEALLQSYLFLGYPAALKGLSLWRSVSGRAAPAAATPDDAEWEARGTATCERVYGGQYARLRRNIAALHPDVERWMIVEGYGKVLARPGLELGVRELCVVALLAPQDATPQLYSHLRGALNAGAAAADIEAAVELLLPLLPAQRATRLREQWEAVRERRGGPG